MSQFQQFVDFSRAMLIILPTLLALVPKIAAFVDKIGLMGTSDANRGGSGVEP